MQILLTVTKNLKNKNWDACYLADLPPVSNTQVCEEINTIEDTETHNIRNVQNKTLMAKAFSTLYTFPQSKINSFLKTKHYLK